MAVLTFLRSLGCPFVPSAVAEAARGGHMGVLEWLETWAQEEGMAWQSQEVCIAAAEGGSLEALRWARQRGCRWGVATTAAAAMGGHLECLKWLRCGEEHKEGCCPWDRSTWTEAAKGGHEHVLQWIQDVSGIIPVEGMLPG
jgi:hypothetical protein